MNRGVELHGLRFKEMLLKVEPVNPKPDSLWELFLDSCQVMCSWQTVARTKPQHACTSVVQGCEAWGVSVQGSGRPKIWRPLVCLFPQAAETLNIQAPALNPKPQNHPDHERCPQPNFLMDFAEGK